MSYVFNPFTGSFESASAGQSSSTVSERLEVIRTANENILKYQPVSLINSVEVVISDVSSNSLSSVYGIALNDALATNPVTILLFGNLDDPLFNFPINTLLFQSSAGLITDQSTTIVGEFFCSIGKSGGNGSIFIDIGVPTEVF